MRLRRVFALILFSFMVSGCVTQTAVAPPPDVEPVAVSSYAPETSGPYRLDSGDRLRIVVFGQEGLSATYAVDAGGSVTMPLIGAVRARGATTQELAAAISSRLRQGYIREPHVAVEVEAYRPFFILGEVTHPGQYPYVANMTVETAVAIAGGFTPRAQKGAVRITRNVGGEAARAEVPTTYPLQPGDTVTVAERWF
ncbi:MAG: polysaccharide export protein [Rhizobiales bacterium]|nr:polysaccharide export protein [Hyphomicrobiales bacterium]